MTEGYITIAEAASILGVKPSTVRYYIRQKQLTPYRRLGRHVYLSEDEVRRFGAIRPVMPPTSSVSHDDMEDGE